MSFTPAYNLVEELRWRGLLHDSIPGTEEKLQSSLVTGYVGFDPTADSLHIGNLVPIMLLVHLQRAGHRPVALVGGATGMVGDPSGKNEERKLLSEEILRHNERCIQAQLERFLDFSPGPKEAVVVNNYDWFSKIGFLEFLRDTGKHITISYMMGKDSVKNRLEAGGISFTEFSYQLVQGYDYYYLNRHYGCNLQMGGSDQWGNITTGTELIRRMGGGEAFALTAPLLTKSDGSKFGKSEGGNVWLDRNRTSPYKFYQFWLNTADDEAGKLIRIFSLLGKEEIEQVEADHAQAPHLRLLQKELAKQVTCLVHSHHDWEQAVKASELLFGNAPASELEALGEQLIMEALEGVPAFDLNRSVIAEQPGILDLLAVHAGIFPSKGEARKMIQGGGVSINREKIQSDQENTDTGKALFGKYLLVQRGKKNYYLIRLL